MCHHLTRAERERLGELDAEIDEAWLTVKEEEPIEDETDPKPDPVPTPS